MYVFKIINDYVLVSDVKNPKMLMNKLLELEDKCNKVYSNSIKISGSLLDQDRKNIIFVQQTVNIFKDILENYNKIVSQMIIDNKKIVFGVRRKKMLKTIFNKLNQIFELDKEIYDNLYNENLSYDCTTTIKSILEITDEISQFKTNDKRQIIYTLVNDKTELSAGIMNIINQLSDMKNSMLDISVGALTFFSNAEEVKGE